MNRIQYPRRTNRKPVKVSRLKPPSQRVYDGPGGPAGTVEAHALALKVKAWQFRAAKTAHKWPQGKELPQSDFLAALAAVAAVRLR